MRADRPWQVKNHWQGHELSRRRRRGAAMVCGTAEQEACPLPGWEGQRMLGWESPNFLSVSFTSPVWFQENARATSVVEPPPSPPRSPGEELLKSSLTQLGMGNAGSGGGFRCHNQNSSHPQRKQLFPSSPALAVCGLSASPSRG